MAPAGNLELLASARGNGRRYRTMSIPGTGLYETKNLGGGGATGGPGCALMLLGPLGLLLRHFV